MRVRGVLPESVQRIVREVSAAEYGGNVVVRRLSPARGTEVNFTLRVKDSRGEGTASAADFSQARRR